MCKNYRESMLIYSLINALRDQDVELLTSSYAKAQNLPFGSLDEKKHTTSRFAQAIADHMQSYSGAKAAETMSLRIKELEQLLVTRSAVSVPAVPVLPPIPAMPPFPPTMPPVMSAPAVPTAPTMPSMFQPAAPANLPYMDLKRKETSTKYLSKVAPGAKGAREVNVFLKKVPVANQMIEDEAKQHSAIFDAKSKDIQDQDMDTLRAYAVDWGLPFKLTADMDPKQLIRTLSAAALANP